MKLDKKSMELYAVTDRSWLGEETLYSQVEKALEGGVTLLQLREKHLSEEEFVKEALSIKELCKKYQVPLIINDSVSVAKEADADGIHVGQSDMEAGDVRKALGPDKIIGVSVRTVEQAVLAMERGADYLGVGAVFSTTSKEDAVEVTKETVKAICEAVTIPVVAIGGITYENVSELKGLGIGGVAVISAIFAQQNIEDATKALKEKVRSVL